MELADADNHQYAGTYPCRLPVWWGRVGEIGPHIEEEGISLRDLQYYWSERERHNETNTQRRAV